MIQPDLFTIQAQSVGELPKPTMSYMDATLNYRSYTQPVRHGLGCFDDEDPQMSTIVECSLPTSAGITQKVSGYEGEREVNVVMYGLAEHRHAGELINWWLEQKNYKLNVPHKETPAGKWILEHAAEMNSARRYWDAVRKQNDVERIELQIEQLQEALRVERLNLGVKVREAAQDKNMTPIEKHLYLKELGALDKDLTTLPLNR